MQSHNFDCISSTGAHPRKHCCGPQNIAKNSWCNRVPPSSFPTSTAFEEICEDPDGICFLLYWLKLFVAHDALHEVQAQPAV